MSSAAEGPFFDALGSIADRVSQYLQDHSYSQHIRSEDLREGVLLYVAAGGKRLRPAILSWSCGAVGGDPDRALPAAAAVELFHTWSLVHDDIIDRDDRRRGAPTVHELFRARAAERSAELSAAEADHYGLSVALLSGDVQHGWSVRLLSELASVQELPAGLALHLIERLESEVLTLLVEGELLDIQFSRTPVADLSIEAIEEMLWKKTGVLYRYCAEAGAMIGLGDSDPKHPYVTALGDFTRHCGIAFQLQDDLLGVLGDPARTGKPVGNDLREGKRTTLIRYAWEQASEGERETIERLLGDDKATEHELRELADLLDRRGGIESTRQRANMHIDAALPRLSTLPEGPYRDLLEQWARYLIDRRI